MVAQLQHRFFISSDRRAVYESTPTGIALLLWHNGRKARLPVDSLPPDAKGLLCPDYRAWEWASEEWDDEGRNLQNRHLMPVL